MKICVVLGLGLCFATVSSPASAWAPITIVAHRGLGAGVPENTLAAVRQSAAQGLQVVELDVRRTRDGHLVILHDATVDRTTDCSGRIEEMTLSALRSCDVGWPANRGERVPTLVEALDLAMTKPVRLLLDVKGAPLGKVVQTVRHHPARPKVILGLRRSRDIARIRAELPDVITLGFISAASDAGFFAEAGAHIVRLWSDWVETDPSLVARTRALGPQAWIMVGRRLPRKDSDWRALHGRLIGLRPQGLITDRPDLISRQ